MRTYEQRKKERLQRRFALEPELPYVLTKIHAYEPTSNPEGWLPEESLYER